MNKYIKKYHVDCWCQMFDKIKPNSIDSVIRSLKNGNYEEKVQSVQFIINNSPLFDRYYRILLDIYHKQPKIDSKQKKQRLDKIHDRSIDVKDLKFYLKDQIYGPIEMDVVLKIGLTNILMRLCKYGKSEVRKECYSVLFELYGQLAYQFFSHRLEQELDVGIKSQLMAYVNSFEKPTWHNLFYRIDNKEIKYVDLPTHVPLPQGFRNAFFDRLKNKDITKSGLITDMTENSNVMLNIYFNFLESGIFIPFYHNETRYISEFIAPLQNNTMFNIKDAPSFFVENNAHLIHLIRHICAFPNSTYSKWSRQLGTIMDYKVALWTEIFRDKSKRYFDIRYVDCILRQIGLYNETDNVGFDLGKFISHEPRFFNWGSDEVISFFETRKGFLNQQLAQSLKKGDYSKPYLHYKAMNSIKGILLRLQKASSIPDECNQPIIKLALQGPNQLSKLAIPLVNRIEGHENQIIIALRNGNSRVRLRAAQYVHSFEIERAEEQLRESKKKEKVEKVKYAMIEALDKISTSEIESITKEQMLDEARESSKRKIPSGVSWFDFKYLQKVKWRDDKTYVDDDVLKWLIIKSFQIKDPYPTRVIIDICSFFDISSAGEFGNMILDEWLAQDIRHYYPHEAEKEFKNNPHKFGYNPRDIKKGRISEEEDRKRYKAAFEKALKTPRGTASSSRGILALVGVFGDNRCIQKVRTYINKHHGKRTKQCIYLLNAIAAIDHPSAIQELKRTSEKFKTKSLRKEANKLLSQIAKGKGWTIDELADRSIFDCDFSNDGIQKLTFGEKEVILTLKGDLSIDIHNGNGDLIKKYKQLEGYIDPSLINSVKKRISEIKRDIREIKKSQTARLYNAMCAQKTWSYSDWRSCFINHPIMPFLSKQIVWGSIEDDRVMPFMITDEKTTVDSKGIQIDVSEKSKIKIIHSMDLDQDDLDKWRGFIKSNKVKMIINQFPTEVYSLPHDLEDPYRIWDFGGIMIKGKDLYKFISRWRYIQGQVGESGTITEIRKGLDSIGIEIFIQFQGHFISNKELDITIHDLHFRKLTVSPDEHGEIIQLKEINPVLLAESYSHLAEVLKINSGKIRDGQDLNSII